MDYMDTKYRIERLEAALEIKRAELEHRIRRQRELSAKVTANTKAKDKFLTRIRLEIKTYIEEINALNTELWGLYEIAPTAEYV